ncbi:MAG: NAD(P)H-dependent oxidoreductase subunit E [Acidobacteria bacterium]|nr:NAD(P)H-dependent oxidoreductase subunit E [Acidobacteriota bacterium]
MNERTGVEERQRTTGELPGFFGTHEPLPADEIRPEVWDLIDQWVAAHPGGRERLIPLLHRVQEEIGYLPFPVQEYVAQQLALSPIEVYGVVSFYHFFTTNPRGRYQLKVCMGTACFVRQGQRVLEAIESLLAIGIGDVTEDRLFSLEQVRCIGACGLAPAMMVNDEVHGHLTATEVRKLVRKLRARARRESAASAEEEASGDEPA